MTSTRLDVESRDHGAGRDARNSRVSIFRGLLDLYSPMVVDAVTVDGVPATVDAGGIIRVQPAYAATGRGVSDRLRVSWNAFLRRQSFRWNTHRASVPMILSLRAYGAPAWRICKDDQKDKATFAIRDGSTPCSRSRTSPRLSGAERRQHRHVQLDHATRCRPISFPSPRRTDS
jgi:hypothetical protein